MYVWFIFSLTLIFNYKTLLVLKNIARYEKLVLQPLFQEIKNMQNAPSKFGYSEKATKFEKIFHLKFDVTE